MGPLLALGNYAVGHGGGTPVHRVTVHVAGFPGWGIAAIVIGCIVVLLLLIMAVAAGSGPRGGVFHRRTIVTSDPAVPARVTRRTDVVEDELV